MTQLGSTTRVAVAATATATALGVGVVGIVLVVDDRRRSGSTVTSSSPSGAAPSATHSTPTNFDGPSARSIAAAQHEEPERERFADRGRWA